MSQPAYQTPADAQAQRLAEGVLEKLFGEEAYRYDLRGGTVRTLTDTRIVYLSADLIKGIHEALAFETGDAWRLVLKQCGHIWGKRVAKSLQSDLRLLTQHGTSELAVDDYIRLLEEYFGSHGWGRLRVDLSDAEAHGIVRCGLYNSLFCAALEDVDGYVDFMISGMLRGLLEAVSATDLDCVQTTDGRREANRRSEFILSGANRISAVEAEAEKGASTDEILELLRAG